MAQPFIKEFLNQYNNGKIITKDYIKNQINKIISCEFSEYVTQETITTLENYYDFNFNKIII